jgi:hypothetical protein
MSTGFRYVDPTAGLQRALSGLSKQEQLNIDNRSREAQQAALQSHQDQQRAMQQQNIDLARGRDALNAKAKNLQIGELERANQQRAAREAVERGLLDISATTRTPETTQVSTGYANDPAVNTAQAKFGDDIVKAIAANQAGGTPTEGYAKQLGDMRRKIGGSGTFMSHSQKTKAAENALANKGIYPTSKLTNDQVVADMMAKYGSQVPEQAEQFKTVKSGKFTDVAKTPQQLFKEQSKVVNADKTLDSKTKREILARLNPDPKLTFDQTLDTRKAAADIDLKNARIKQIEKDVKEGSGSGFKFGPKAAAALDDTDFDLDDAENMDALTQILNNAKSGGVKLDDAMVDKIIRSADSGWTFTDSGQLANIKSGIAGLLRAEEKRKQ